MSYPTYLNGIINAHLRNKEIEHVRSEIKKFIPITSLPSVVLQPQDEDTARSIERNGFTVSNFFQSKAQVNNQVDPYFNHGKTATHMTGKPWNKLTKRISLPITKRYEIPNQNDEDSSQEQKEQMLEWRIEMLKHLKQSKEGFHKKKVDSLSPKKEEKEKSENTQSSLKKSKTTETLVMKKAKQMPKIKPMAPQSERVIQKNIILIKPSQIMRDNSINKPKKIVPKRKKAFFMPKPLQRIESEYVLTDDLHQQRLANFHALIPYIGSQKAKVENRLERKKQYVPIFADFKEKPDSISKEEFIGKICGWDIRYEDH